MSPSQFTKTSASGVQPADLTTCEGKRADLNIFATGSNLTYQWKKDGTNLSNGGNITGALSPNLIIIGLTTSYTGVYNCVVTGSCGTVSSMGAALSVDNHITVSQNPVTQDACAGENVVFNSSATGSHIVSQWYKNGLSLPGETGGSLILSSVTAASAGSYYTTFTNSCGTVATSHATLVMDEATVITSQPAGVTLCEGDNTNFTVGATGTGLSYQWYLNGLALSEAGSFAGSQSNTLVVSGATTGDAGVILCRVTGSCGSVTSDPAGLAVNATTVITLQPVNQVVCPGTNVSFGTTASGSHLSYQWQRNGTDIAGATGTTLTLNNVSDANEGLYRCRISGDCGTAYTTPASLGVMEGVSIGSNPVDQQTCQGNNTGFTVSASGTALSYQWMKNGSVLNDDGRITGTHTGSLQIGSTLLSDQATYSCKVTSTCGAVHHHAGVTDG